MQTQHRNFELEQAGDELAEAVHSLLGCLERMDFEPADINAVTDTLARWEKAKART